MASKGFQLLFSCINGPRLYRIHRTTEGVSSDYAPFDLESYSDGFMKWVHFFRGFCYWTSPALVVFLYRRDVFTSVQGYVWLVKMSGVVICAYYIALSLRGISRFNNTTYTTFMEVLEASQANWTPAHRLMLSSYDFEFSAWPADFRYKRELDEKREFPEPIKPVRGEGLWQWLRIIPLEALSYVAIHTFGKRMIFPGATSMQHLLVKPLAEGRAKLVEQKHGHRAKLVSEDGNEIDTMFVDRRNNADFLHGNTLVIGCEGNAGFYEVGICVTPLDAGYSVLGWNHPGFAGSTGFPSPASERAAIDAVLQYATVKLGFAFEEIVIFAWSIGAYSATYAAQSHPTIKYMILDATFDEITPLALKSMPASWGSLVRYTIDRYMNLNNIHQISRYHGPVRLIRRTNDEIITTGQQGDVSRNRGNVLLMGILKHRYPQLLSDGVDTVLEDYLSMDTLGQVVCLSEHSVDEDLCESIMSSYVTEQQSHEFPWTLGEGLPESERIALVLFLASKYMSDFAATHCSPLPALEFRQPWHARPQD